MTAVAQRLVEVATAEIGVREESRNGGKRVREYQAATWLRPDAWPWCAAFVAWCLLESIQGNTGWRCRDASAYGWEAWARKRGFQVLPETAPMLPGDLVTFDFSHIGIVVADHGDTIETIEGNTNADGAREGDGVYRKMRARRLIRAVIRIEEPS